MQDIDIDDIPSKGSLLTWCNGREGMREFIAS